MRTVMTPMAVYLVAGPRATIMPGLEAIPCSESELVAIEEQAQAEAVAAERKRILAIFDAVHWGVSISPGGELCDERLTTLRAAIADPSEALTDG